MSSIGGGFAPTPLISQALILNSLIGAFTSGSVIFAGSTGGLTQDNAFFAWDDVGKRLLIIDANLNVTVGLDAFKSNTTGVDNVAVGYQALYSNTTASGNAAVGFNALFSNTTGANNVAVGHKALYSNTTAFGNAAVGYNALFSNTTGANNVAVGHQALYSNTTAAANTAVGYHALYSNTTAAANTAVGYHALYNITTGGSNVALGYQAGKFISGGVTANQTSTQSVYIGRDTMALADGDVNEIVIGYNAVGAGSKTITLGSTAITKTILQGVVSQFNGLATAGFGLPPILGVVKRTGLTAADASATTLYTTTAAGQLFMFMGRILATAGTTPSATYTLKWTEGGAVITKTLTISALDADIDFTALIQPDNATSITVQLTAISGAGTTVNVAATVQQMA